MVFAIGFNTRAPVLAYISGHIDPVHDTARLYTLISILDAFVHMAGSPLIEILWARGLDIGGDWLALPFIISGVGSQPHAVLQGRLLRITVVLFGGTDSGCSAAIPTDLRSKYGSECELRAFAFAGYCRRGGRGLVLSIHEC